MLSRIHVAILALLRSHIGYRRVQRKMREHILFLLVVQLLIIILYDAFAVVQTVVGKYHFLQISQSDRDDHALVGDVEKSHVFCKAPDHMMGGKKRTRKSDKGGKGRIEVSRYSDVLVYAHL